MPRCLAVPMTERTAANRSAPQSERNPPVTLRYVAVGRSSRSLPLLSAVTSGCVRKVKRCSRTLPYRLRRRWPSRWLGASTITALSSRSSRRRYSRRVLSARSRWRRASTTARSSRAFMRGANTVSPASMAYWRIGSHATDARGTPASPRHDPAARRRDPDRRPVPVQHLADHTGAATGADHVNDDVVVLKHPVPAGPSGNTDRGLVRADHAGAARPGENAGDIGIEAWLATAECRVQGALADAQAIQVQHHTAEPPVADGMHEAQIHRQGHDADAERRARLQPVRHRRRRGAIAALAVSGVPLHPRHHRLNLGQINLVVARVERLI